jgi:predicted ATPase
MIFSIENLGIIEKANVDLDKNLILLCGHNNTGKSYLAYGIYHWLTLNKGHTLANLIDSEIILNKIAEKLENTEAKGNQVVINLVEIYRAGLSPHKTAIFDNILKQYVQGLGDFFRASSNGFFGNLCCYRDFCSRN